MEYINENSDIFQLLENLKREIQKEELEDPLERIEARIKKCCEEMDNLVTTISEGKPNPALIERINVRIQQLDQELTKLKEKQAHLEQVNLTDDERQLKGNLLVSCLSSLKNNFDELTIQDKRTLLKLLIEKITWDGENLHIFIYGE